MEVKSINHITFPEAAEAVETEAEVGNKKGYTKGFSNLSKDGRKRDGSIAIKPSHHHHHLLRCLVDLLVIGI